MSRADSAKKRLNAALSRIGGMAGRAYLRVRNVSGGNALIGRPAQNNYTDTLFNPQPTWRMLGSRAPFINVNGKQVNENDLHFVFSADAVGDDTFDNPNTYLVIKQDDGDEDVFQVINWNIMGIAGKDIATTVIARSITRMT